MEDEDVEERETDEDNLLAENPELRSVAAGIDARKRWIALRYLQCCKFGQLFRGHTL